MHTTAQLDSLEQKRSASLIFRIEQLLPSTSITPTTMTTSSTETTLTATTSTASPAKRMRMSNPRPGVYTSQYTPKDTCSIAIPTSALLGSTAMPTDGGRSHCQLSNGELIVSGSLLRQIKLSEDVYSFNAIFELHCGQVRVRLVRDVAREDEIVAWFGEELVLLMGIPFLTPLNIQGNSRYMCHLCHLTFETPHPLKIHLALGCGRSAMDILWMRLHYSLKAAARSHTETQHSPIPATSSTSSASPTHSPPPQMPPRFSAFRPIAALTQSLPMVPVTTAATPLSYLPSMSMATAPLSTHPMNAAAQIEAIVSNMGASKQGHLCIYCGKVYSRKYGLKIHIRTHTGFKPLKCKFCLRPFGDPSNLNKHVRLHLQTHPSSSAGVTDGGAGGAEMDGDVDIEGETDADYQCHVCHKSFPRRRDLQRHMETRHSGHHSHSHSESRSSSTSTSSTTTMTATVTTSTSKSS
ncbi:Krueppel-like factor 7 [Drosophila mauritiana]|uniref:Krueppel-like factor 7 n=1 Tax=Drosophila mauritiana TaxID=7226 RepID=A0A6P8K7W9_DROMA|nr:Krueppel-like factor 7 [Drosophila mauritiana]